MEDAGAFRSYSEAAATPEDFARYWHGQIRAAKQRREEWMQECQDSIDVYRQSTESHFNIHYSNVRTRASARFNSSPIPDVRPAHLDNDQVAKATASLMERSLMQQQDAFDLDAVIKSAVLADELTGQGQVRVYWDVDTYEEIDLDPMTGEEAPRQVVRREFAKVSYVPHGHYLEGPATVWEDTPWIAFKMFWTREDLAQIGVAPEVIEELSFDADPLATGGDDHAPGERTRAEHAVGHVCGWQIWHKETRTVILLAEEHEKAVLFVDDDPLPRFPGFFPVPRPLQSIEVPGSRIPVCPYSLYKHHHEALTEATKRIQRLTAMLRYRGFRAAELEDMVRLEELDDGEFAPLDGSLALISQGGSLDGAIWNVPIETLVKVLRELVDVREAIKQTVYEVTGISDVMRGATDSRETATAQELKANFGSLRVTDAQAEVSRFVRDVIRLQAEVVATHFGDDTLMKIAAPSNEQEMAVTQQALQYVRSDDARYYRVDIETDSTIRADVTRAQQNAAAFLTAAGSYAQTMMPLVQMGLPSGPILKLFGAITSHYKLGKQAELAVEELLQMAGAEEQRQQAEKPQKEAEAEAKQDQMEQLAMRGQAAEVAKTEAEAQKTALEAQGQAVETQQHAMMGPQTAEDFIE